MKKELNWMWLIGVILIGILLWQYNAGFLIFTPGPQTFYQYTGRPSMNGYWVSGYPERGVYFTETRFNLGDSEFKFVSNIGEWGSCGTNPDQTIIGTCCESIYVYKDNILIDTIKQGYVGNLVNQNINSTQIHYNSSDKCEGVCSDSNFFVSIQPKTQSYFSNSACSSIANAYILHFPENSFEVNLANLDREYHVGDNVLLKINITNNLAETNAKLKLKYEVNTLIGTYSTLSNQEVNLSYGDNIFEVIIPSNKITDELVIYPEIKIFYPTSNIYGVTSDGQNNIQSNPYLTLGSVIGNSSIISILNNSIIIINDTIIINETSNCSDWGLCEDSNGNCITCGQDPEKNCTYFYYKDNDNKSCSYKEFCNDTYDGLETFSTKDECEKGIDWKWPIIGLIALIIGGVGYFIWRKK